MKQNRVAFQGEPGAYSEAAAFQFFGPETEAIPCYNFETAFEKVASRACTYAMLPIENSLAGSIHQNYDLMLQHDLQIIGEYHLRVSHCLLALPGARLEDIRTVQSHPQALAQCDGSLTRMGLGRAVEYDTAGAARLLLERNDPALAALASRRAAEVYGLQILAANMEDNPLNYTRFLALTSPEHLAPAPGPEDKTTIVFSLKNHPGALFKALSVFALRDIDLTKIESRPIQGKLWEYMFYVDFAGHVATPPCARAIDHLKEMAADFRILGSYPRHRLEEAPLAGN